MGVDSLKVLKALGEKCKTSIDLILMVDEMYLQKAAQYQAREYVGGDEEGNLYKGIVAFMVVGLKQSIPLVVWAIPEITFNGEWLCDKIASNIENLENTGFCVRDLLLTITSLMLMLLLYSKVFLIPNQSHVLSIQLTMASKRTSFLIPFILLRTTEVIY